LFDRKERIAEKRRERKAEERKGKAKKGREGKEAVMLAVTPCNSPPQALQ